MSFLENAKRNDAIGHLFLTHALSISQGSVTVHPGMWQGGKYPSWPSRQVCAGSMPQGLQVPGGAQLIPPLSWDWKRTVNTCPQKTCPTPALTEFNG